MKKADEVMVIALLLVAMVVFAVVFLRYLAESQVPREYKASDMRGACKYQGNLTLAREEMR